MLIEYIVQFCPALPADPVPPPDAHPVPPVQAAAVVRVVPEIVL